MQADRQESGTDGWMDVQSKYNGIKEEKRKKNTYFKILYSTTENIT